jgi:hypothetical protein
MFWGNELNGTKPHCLEGIKTIRSNHAKIVTGFVGLHKGKFLKILTHSVQTALCAVNI